jgi:superfamily II DNA or RNA helicase
MVELRPYQIDIINKVRENIKNGVKSICVVAPCGSGKSIIQGKIADMCCKKNNTVLFIVHRKELCEQISNTFRMIGVDMSKCSVNMVQTVSRRLDKIPEPSVIITDENHHCMAKTYTKIYDKFSSSIKLGFTATPIRLDGKGLGQIYDEMVETKPIKWFIKNNYLSPYKLFGVKLVDTSNLHVRMGDFDKKEVEQLIDDNKSKIYGDTIENYKKLADGKKTIVYCNSIKVSQGVETEFNNNNITCKHLDGSTNASERSKAIQDFRDGKIKILTNVDLFGEGFDVPDCECVILLRPTKSLSLYIQQSMRSMRYKKGKEAIIIDHVGNCYEHGFPDDERTWDLNPPKKKKNKKNEEKIKICPTCLMALELLEKLCPFCGHDFKKTKQEREALEKVEAELSELTSIDILKAKRHDYYKEIKTLRELINFSEAKSYKKGWLIYKMKEIKSNLYAKKSDLKYIQKKFNYKNMWWTHYTTGWRYFEND